MAIRWMLCWPLDALWSEGSWTPLVRYAGMLRLQLLPPPFSPSCSSLVVLRSFCRVQVLQLTVLLVSFLVLSGSDRVRRSYWNSAGEIQAMVYRNMIEFGAEEYNWENVAEVSRSPYFRWYIWPFQARL